MVLYTFGGRASTDERTLLSEPGSHSISAVFERLYGRLEFLSHREGAGGVRFHNVASKDACECMEYSDV